MGIILISPNKKETLGPVIFLAGPVRSAPDWQSDAIGLLSVNQSVDIASPRQARDESVPLSSEEVIEQIAWEQSYMNIAREGGVVLFWFAKPRKGEESPYYAQQSFFELGDTLAETGGGTSICLGIEEGFQNGEYLMETVNRKYPNLIIHKTLTEVCDQALRLIRTQYI